MRYVVSDIHGNKEAWESIKKKIKFSDNDEMYILGDVIDRGEHGIEILMEIMNTHNMYMIRGNHEDMMCNALIINDEHSTHLWYRNGGLSTHRDLHNLTRQDQLCIISYLQRLPLQYKLSVPCTLNDSYNAEVYNFYLCHANIKEVYENISRIDLTDTIDEFCNWDRKYIYAVRQYAKLGKNDIVIHGHTPTVKQYLCTSKEYTSRASIIEHDFHVYNIDCGALYPALGGRLACMCLETCTDESTWIYSE